eukprot:scaffold1014_cov34-Attheya_sp.AAC.1
MALKTEVHEKSSFSSYKKRHIGGFHSNGSYSILGGITIKTQTYLGGLSFETNEKTTYEECIIRTTVLPCNMDKEAFYSLIVTVMSSYANHFNFGYYKRLEVLSLLFTVNGPDRIHTVLTTWMTTNYCPKGLLPCAFMSACCDMFGSTVSEGSFARYQFSSAFGTTIDDWIPSLVTIAHVCERANKGQMK